MLTRKDFIVQRKFNGSAACFPFSVNHNDKLFAIAGRSPLHYAAAFGSIEIVQMVFDRVQTREPLTPGKDTPLCIACGSNSPDVGESKLLKPLLSPDGSARKTAVFVPHFRCLLKTETKHGKKAPRNSNSSYLVTFFLEKGADMNHGNANGWTPLIYAIEWNKLENVKLLLDCGADVEKANKDGETFRVLLFG